MTLPRPIRAVPIALALSLVAAASPQDPAPEGQQPAREPAQEAPVAPARKLGNMHAVVVTSRARFTGSEEPYLWEMTFAFPDRARWCLYPERKGDRVRNLVYQYGDGASAWDASAPASRILAADERNETLRQMQLVRAAFLWPDAFEWRETGAGFVKDLGEIGMLFVEKSDGERPTAFHALAPGGEVGESIFVEAWMSANDRSWPAKWRVESGGGIKARQELVNLDCSARFHDAYFTPPDRRTVWKSSAVRRVQNVDLESRPVRRVPLASDGTFAAALEEAEGVHARWREDAPGLEPWITLELDARARPRAVWLELAPGRTPPADWTVRPEDPALAITLEGVEDVTRSLLNEMARGLEEGVEAGPALVRLGGGRERIQVLLPLKVRR